MTVIAIVITTVLATVVLHRHLDAVRFVFRQDAGSRIGSRTVFLHLQGHQLHSSSSHKAGSCTLHILGQRRSFFSTNK